MKKTDFVTQMLELGAELEKAKDGVHCSMIINDANKLYDRFIADIANGDDTSHGIALHEHFVSVSLRDFFAAEAMKAECISWNAELSNDYRAKILEDMIERWGQTTVYEAIALNSWEMADNMLKAKSHYER